MAAEQRDLEVVGDLIGGAGSTLVTVHDPLGVARALVDAVAGARLVDAEQLVDTIAEVRAAIHPDDRLRAHAERVRAAERVLAGAVATEASRAEALVIEREAEAPVAVAVDEPAAPMPPAVDRAEVVADRQTIRFALVILVLAQLGGLAVFVVGGDLIAAVVPALALIGLAGVVLTHHRPHTEERGAGGDDAAAPASIPAPVHLPSSPAVRAAEAHLRRQQAAWKVAWWERGLTPPPVSSWDGAPMTATLVAVDRDGTVDDAAFATMTAGLPAVIRVVVVAGPVA